MVWQSSFLQDISRQCTEPFALIAAAMFSNAASKSRLYTSRSSLPFMSARYAHRAVVFTRNGEPASVLSTLTYPALPPPPPHSLNLKFRLSPINPSDINVVEGIYPSKPEPTKSLSAGQQLTESVCVPGNEGLAEVTDVGEGVTDIQKGDWVVMAKPQAGTWSSARTLGSHEVIKLDKGNISEVNAATIAVCQCDCTFLPSSTNTHRRSTRPLLISCCATMSISTRETG